MTRTVLSLVAMTLLSSACNISSEREVFVRIPVSRLELPEPAPRQFGAGPAVGGEALVTLTKDQTTTAPNPDAPEFSDNTTQIARFDFQVQPTLGLAFKSQRDGLAQGQIKWIALGPGTLVQPLSLALTASYGISLGDNDFVFNAGPDNARTKLDQSVVDLAMVFGFKLSPQWMAYGGPYYARTDYDGTHSADRGNDPDVNIKFEGQAELIGGNIGLAWSYANWGRLLAEYSLARVEAGRRADRIGHAAFSAEFFFGRRLEPELSDDSDPAVQVVPVENPPLTPP